MQVKWLRRALENLDDEAAYIAEDNPRVAAEFVRHMRESAAKLADHPNVGRPGRIAGTRELVVTRFPTSSPIACETVLWRYCVSSTPPENGLGS